MNTLFPCKMNNAMARQLYFLIIGDLNLLNNVQLESFDIIPLYVITRILFLSMLNVVQEMLFYLTTARHLLHECFGVSLKTFTLLSFLQTNYKNDLSNDNQQKKRLFNHTKYSNVPVVFPQFSLIIDFHQIMDVVLFYVVFLFKLILFHTLF